jgi:hypothetical protein
LPFNIFDIRDINNRKFYDEKLSKSINNTNKYEALRSFILSSQETKPFKNYLEKEVIQKTPERRYVVIILPPMLANIPDPITLKKYVTDDKIYYQTLYLHSLNARL